MEGILDWIGKRIRETFDEARGKKQEGGEPVCPRCKTKLKMEALKGDCPQCGLHLPDVFKIICPRCGESLPVGAQICTKCSLDFEERTYRCPRCGYLAHAIMTECPGCGVRFM